VFWFKTPHYTIGLCCRDVPMPVASRGKAVSFEPSSRRRAGPKAPQLYLCCIMLFSKNPNQVVRIGP
jgi:hypothetical protein